MSSLDLGSKKIDTSKFLTKEHTDENHQGTLSQHGMLRRTNEDEYDFYSDFYLQKMNSSFFTQYPPVPPNIKVTGFDFIFHHSGNTPTLSEPQKMELLETDYNSISNPETLAGVVLPINTHFTESEEIDIPLDESKQYVWHISPFRETPLSVRDLFLSFHVYYERL